MKYHYISVCVYVSYLFPCFRPSFLPLHPLKAALTKGYDREDGRAVAAGIAGSGPGLPRIRNRSGIGMCWIGVIKNNLDLNWFSTCPKKSHLMRL